MALFGCVCLSCSFRTHGIGGSTNLISCFQEGKNFDRKENFSEEICVVVVVTELEENGKSLRSPETQKMFSKTLINNKKFYYNFT